MNSRESTNFFSRHRRMLLVLVDIALVLFAYLGTWALISGRESLTEYRSLLFSSCVLFVLCFITVYELMGLYDSLWNFAELYEFFRCALASAISITVFLKLLQPFSIICLRQGDNNTKKGGCYTPLDLMNTLKKVIRTYRTFFIFLFEIS